MASSKKEISVKTRVEHLSFECNRAYMDVVSHDGYVDITIGGVENEKFSVTLEEWQEINEQVVKLLKQG